MREFSNYRVIELWLWGITLYSILYTLYSILYTSGVLFHMERCIRQLALMFFNNMS